MSIRYDLPREIKADAKTTKITSFMLLVTEKNSSVDLAFQPLRDLLSLVPRAARLF